MCSSDLEFEQEAFEQPADEDRQNVTDEEPARHRKDVDDELRQSRGIQAEGKYRYHRGPLPFVDFAVGDSQFVRDLWWGERFRRAIFHDGTDGTLKTCPHRNSAKIGKSPCIRRDDWV